ncbi:MAG: SDR family oxidoreductase [Rhodobacteraceae bacterium]|nr:SDR family oxidoreductase [Paracoccaceae bacterium]MCY4197304.1 SDR family oxidoreductase [Paracoccaceae bacterium]MCY4326140.1 SDR family oxidoreductase [Paracoccaceae bacterium]
MRFSGKTALVTGGADGFGREIARQFSSQGANVVIADINGPGAEKVAAALPGQSLAVECDVAKGTDIRSVIQRTAASFEIPQIVVNNAGWSHVNQPLLETSEDELRRVYDVNVFSIYHMTQVIVPYWRKHKNGVMINISSTAGQRPRPGLTWYNSSKGAVNTLTRSLAAELAPDNIRVCAIAPVAGTTGLLETFLGKPDTPENRQGFLDSIPLGRLCDPLDVANAALFLASDEAEFMTGVVLDVDGGRSV